MKKSTQHILTLLFFIAYALLMLYEGVFKELREAASWQWIILFALGAGITYWAHKKSGVITIALLFLHTTLELAHHGNEVRELTIIAGIVFAVHFLFDAGFLWSEIKHHSRSPMTLFGTVLFFYGLIFVSSILAGHGHAGILESTEMFSSAITGGIFACVIAHAMSIVQRLRVTARIHSTK